MNFKFLGLLSALVMLVASCATDENPGGNGSGRIKASIQANSKVSLSTSISRDGTEAAAFQPELNLFSLSIAKEDGSYSHTWETVNDFDPTQQFAVGSYEIEASYGSLDIEGFDKPYYYGKSTFTVSDGETAEPNVIATLANTMVNIAYTDAFKKYFTNYSAVIHSAGGGYVDFTKDEVRTAYVRPGKISLELELTKTTGTTFKFNPADIENALPRTLYNITFDVNGGEVGDAKLVITFDSSTVNEPIEVDLSDEIINAPAPTVKATGFTDNTPINIIEGDEAPSALKLNLTALSGLKSVVMTTSSEFLTGKGVPVELDLMAATETQKTLLQSLGLKTTGLWTRPDKMAIIDFTDMVKNLRVANNSGEHNITIQVKDIYTKVSDPITLAINAPAVQLALADAGQIFVGAPSETATLTYNGENLTTNVKIKAMNSFGSWVDQTITNVESLGSNKYKITFTIPEASEALKFKAVYKGVKETSVITVNRDNPNYTITMAEGDAWATSAYITVETEDASMKSVMTNFINVYIKAGSGSYAKTNNIVKDTQNGIIEIKGLTPGTQYSIKGNISTNAETDSNELAFTTENAATLPNGDFETLAQTINISSINQGGTWSSLSQWTPKQTTTSYNVSEPTGWASVNSKTCAYDVANAKNTWFVIPSTLNSSTVQSGSNSMMIRNVSWDLNGSVPGRSTNTNYDNFSTKTPNIANTSAGKLFLGTYSFDAGSLSENYVEGVSFTSRPAKLQGYYTYATDSQDTEETGVAIVTVLNGTTVIGTGRATLSAVGTYTLFNAEITYTNKSLKATSIRVMLSSSSHASYTLATETSSIKTTKRTNNDQNAYGAVLYVDNLSFTY